MPTSDVFPLEEYRARRKRRLHRTLALNRGSRTRSRVLDRFAEISDLLGADRVVAAWIDEIGGVEAHPWAVLDLASDRPRRHVDPDILLRAARDGLPGFVVSGPNETEPRRWVVSMGSDGLQHWFVLVEAEADVGPLTVAARDQLLWLAGGCSAVLLHRRLEEEGAAMPGLQSDRPSGADERESVTRETVAEMARYLLEEGMVPEEEAHRFQLDTARERLQGHPLDDGSRAVMKGAERLDPVRLSRGLADLAWQEEAGGRFPRSADLYHLSYEAACIAGSCDLGVGAARGRARSFRRLAHWDVARKWYEVARGIAKAVGDTGEEAVALDGVANVDLGRGRVPTARRVLKQARVLAQRAGDPDALAAIQFSLMSVAHIEGRLEDAAARGWKAFRGFRTRDAKLRALTALGGVFLEGRRLDSAEDAFAVVVRETAESYYRLYGLAGLARVQAARGDREVYEMQLSHLDEMGLDSSAPELRADVSMEVGDGYRDLGVRSLARRWYRKALRISAAHDVNEFLIRAEQRLESMDEEDERPTEPATARSDGEGGEAEESGGMTAGAEVEAICRDLQALRAGAAALEG